MAASFIDEMERRYEGSLSDERVGLITLALKSTRSRAEKASIAKSAYDMAERAASEDEFEIAVKLLETAATESRRAGDTELAKAANQRSRAVKQVRDQFRVAEKARNKIDSGSAKAEDFLTLGQFHCFLRGEWDEGLPLMAKGSDAVLKKLAGDDRQQPQIAKDQSALAVRWKTYGESEKDQAYKMAGLRRAYFWYAKAAPQLSGLSRARVQRSLDELAQLTGGVSTVRGADKLAFLDVKPGEIHRFQGHTREIRALAVSPSGRYTASASCDGTIRVWDTATGKSIHMLTTDGGRSNDGGVAITPDEKYVLAGSGKNTVAAWELKTGNPAFAIPAGSSVCDIDVSADGRKLLFAVSSSKANLGVFGLAKRKPLGVLKSPAYPRRVQISADGNKAISSDMSRNISLWNLVSFRQIASFSPPSGSL